MLYLYRFRLLTRCRRIKVRAALCLENDHTSNKTRLCSLNVSKTWKFLRPKVTTKFQLWRRWFSFVRLCLSLHDVTQFVTFINFYDPTWMCLFIVRTDEIRLPREFIYYHIFVKFLNTFTRHNKNHFFVLQCMETGTFFRDSTSSVGRHKNEFIDTLRRGNIGLFAIAQGLNIR